MILCENSETFAAFLESSTNVSFHNRLFRHERLPLESVIQFPNGSIPEQNLIHVTLLPTCVLTCYPWITSSSSPSLFCEGISIPFENKKFPHVSSQLFCNIFFKLRHFFPQQEFFCSQQVNHELESLIHRLQYIHKHENLSNSKVGPLSMTNVFHLYFSTTFSIKFRNILIPVKHIKNCPVHNLDIYLSINNDAKEGKIYVAKRLSLRRTQRVQLHNFDLYFPILNELDLDQHFLFINVSCVVSQQNWNERSWSQLWILKRTSQISTDSSSHRILLQDNCLLQIQNNMTSLLHCREALNAYFSYTDSLKLESPRHQCPFWTECKNTRKPAHVSTRNDMFEEKNHTLSKGLIDLWGSMTSL